MRGYKKHQFLTALLVFAVVLAGVCVFELRDDYLTKEQIFALVESQGAALEDIARSDAPGQMKAPEGVQKVTTVDGIVDFSCGGAGKGEDTVYYGFYYSPGDTPEAVFRGTRFGAADQLQPEGEGVAIRIDEGKFYYTEKIGANFYYYEAHL